MNRFYFSKNRGHHWDGPFRLELPGLLGKLSARTDYIVNSDQEAFFFWSVEPQGQLDRAFCARTTDGMTFQFTGWMTGENPGEQERWVMPATVKVGEYHFVSALRRKKVSSSKRDWIDVYDSVDNGKTWLLKSRVAETTVPGSDYGGNPPAMIRLQDGSLCVAYGVRAKPYRIAAKMSRDNGQTWSPEIILRQGARNWDLGYPRLVQRNDGKIVTIYYFATPRKREQFIAATIWDPQSIKW